MTKIGIIGTGKIGSQLIRDLIECKSISEIHLWNRDLSKLDWNIETFKISAHDINPELKIRKLDWQNINQLNLIALSIKERYDPRELLKSDKVPTWIPKNLRYIGLELDLKILHEISQKLCNFEGKIAVISNPVDVNTFFISKWLPKATVFGLGASVDSLRLANVIKQETGVYIKSGSFIVVGEHGTNLIPVSGIIKSSKSLKKFSKEQIDFFLNKTSETGVALVKKRGHTIFDCSICFTEDIKWLLQISKKEKIKSFSFFFNNCCISRPIIFNANLQDYQPFNIFTEQEKLQIIPICNRINSIISTIESNINF